MLHVREFLDERQTYKTFIISVDDETSQNVATNIQQHGYDVGVITYDHTEDERPTMYLDKLRAFDSSSTRVLCISYKVLMNSQIQNDIERHAMQHDLLVLCSLEPHMRDTCITWVRDAHRRGFRMKNTYTIVSTNLDDTCENFLIHNIEW